MLVLSECIACIFAVSVCEMHPDRMCCVSERRLEFLSGERIDERVYSIMAVMNN